MANTIESFMLPIGVWRTLAALGETLAAFGRRRIRVACVAPRDFHHGLLGLLALAGLFSWPGPASAQSGVPFARYRTFETEHFAVTFETALEDYARRAASQAEEAYARLARAYGETPRGKIRIVAVDQGDLFNGSATPFPTNRVIAFAHTPVEGEGLFTFDPSELLITHELAHIFHLDQAGGGWRWLRRVFGRNELTFPHVFDGSYLIEGLATFYESRLTAAGRVRGSAFPEELRAALLETDGPRLDEAEFDPGAWPLDRHYSYGSQFIEDIARRYGERVPAAWMAERASIFRSIISRGAGVGPLFGGRSLPEAWRDWIAGERDRARRLRDELQRTPPGITATRRVCEAAHYNAFPRVSPDGRRLAFISTDEARQPLGLFVADLETCRSRRLTRLNSAHVFSWSPDGRALVFSQWALKQNARAWSDLYRVDVDTGNVTRLTTWARVAAPDVHPSGLTAVVVQYEDERSRLATVDLESGRVTPLTGFSPTVAWGPARWSPDGSLLAAIRFVTGAGFDLVLLSPDGTLVRTVTDDAAVESVAEWGSSSPDGARVLFFTSDRSGIRELYGAELSPQGQDRPYIVARVATGIHDVAAVKTARPGGTANEISFVVTVTHADGRHLEGFSVDRSRWIEAAPPVSAFASREPGAMPPMSPATMPSRPYSPARDILPAGWSPIFGVQEGLGTFAGTAASGLDVIQRHAWQANAAMDSAGRTIGSADYVYHRFSHAQMFGHVESRWRVEERVDTPAGEILRLERKRMAQAGVQVPWFSFRRGAVLRASIVAEERARMIKDVPASLSDPQPPLLAGGAIAFDFNNAQAGLRSISQQDGVRLSGSFDYLSGRTGGWWRSSSDVAASAYRSFPSWTAAGRPVLAATVRVAQQRGPAAGRLTAGGVGSTVVFDSGTSTFVIRGYPVGLVAANALWSVRAEVRLPIARVSRGLGPLPLYLRALSASWFVDGVGAASRVGRFGSPQLLSTGVELVTDASIFSFLPLRVRTGIGVPLKTLGSVSRGEPQFYAVAGVSF